MSDEISQPVRQMITDSIGSVSELEAILLLRENRERAWTVAEAAERLYLTDNEVARLFARLAQRGFFTACEGRYLYAAAPDVDATVGGLAAAYARNVVAVTNLIHMKSAAGALELAEMSQRRR